MASRREVLKGGVAALTLPVAARAGLPGADVPGGGPADAHAFRAVIFDRRFAPSQAFGAAAQRLGLPVAAIEGDITALWFDTLEPAWRRQPAPIAGLTAHGALFCLERLAWDHDLRVVYRAAHAHRGPGRLEHALQGPPAMLRAGAALAAAGSQWSECVAGMLAQCPIEAQARTELTVFGAGTAGGEQDVLYSFLIAPRVRG